jgi:hypothetical protein
VPDVTEIADYPGVDDGYDDFDQEVDVDENDYDQEPPYELTGAEEHWRDQGTSSTAELHSYWHRLHQVPMGQTPCPWDACDPAEEPPSRWSVEILSANFCDHTGPCGDTCPDGHPAEPPF